MSGDETDLSVTVDLAAAGRRERLKDAVKAAGGPREVSQRSGVPLSTLNDHLAGRDMRLETAIRIAGVCRVNLTWLATGRGSRVPMYPIHEPAQPRTATFDIQTLWQFSTPAQRLVIRNFVLGWQQAMDEAYMRDSAGGAA